MFQAANDELYGVQDGIMAVLKTVEVQYLHRYDDHNSHMSAGEKTETFPRSALWNEDEPAVVLNRYRIVSHTPCGCWIFLPYNYPDYKRFVMADTKKCFARLTEKKALEDYIYRKRYQIRMLENQAKRARQRLDIAIELSLKPSEQTANEWVHNEIP